MKKQFLIGVLAVATALSASASVTSYTGSPYLIPDGNPNGVSSSLTVSGENISLSSLTVTLSISGGYNGDLYAYLSYNGTLVTLLNRVGSGTTPFGYGDSGFNVTLDAGSPGIQTYQSGAYNLNGSGALTGTWGAAGNLGDFNTLDPNGTWTLFFADLSGGGGTSTVNGWSLNLTAVPEPVNVALGVFAVLLAGCAVMRSNRLKQWRNVLSKE